jgi:signal transduction histidine kinase
VAAFADDVAIFLDATVVTIETPVGEFPSLRPVHMSSKTAAQNSTSGIGLHDQDRYGSWSLALAEGQLVRVDDTSAADIPEAGHRVLDQYGVGSLLAIPILVFDKFAGFVAFGGGEPRPWESQELAVLENIVQALSRAIERRISREQLEVAADRLSFALHDARGASEAKSSFLASMSHEIRTPMTAVAGYADLLTRPGQSSSTRQEWARQLRQNADYLLALVNDVLDVSKIEAGEIETNITQADLAELVSSVIALMRPRAEDKSLEFELSVLGRIPKAVATDALRFRQILVNLLSNAIKFTEKGKILLELESDTELKAGRTVLFARVIDTGPGIEKSWQARIFEPFSQASDTNEANRKGTGLGLAISRDFARLLGGDLEVRSTPGLGSVFTASIDAGATETMTWSDTLDAASSAEPTAYEPDQDRLKSTRVLVVDDNPENVRIIRFLLLEAGAVVDSAVNGQAGVDAVLAAEEQDRPFDVVLMDMMMPVMDGYEATRELRRSGCQVPVLAITAFAMAGDREKCLSAGCDDHLSKPIASQKRRQTRPRTGTGFVRR